MPAGAYTIVKSSPAGYVDGYSTIGKVNGAPRGAATGSQFCGIVLGEGENGLNYNFAERLSKIHFLARK